MVRLPQGTVELVGVSAIGEGIWWRPDGQFFNSPPFEIPEHEQQFPQTDYHLFVFKIDRQGSELRTPEWSVDLVRPVAGWEPRIRTAFADPGNPADYWYVAVPMQTNVKTTEVKLGLTTGGWMTVSRANRDLTVKE
jgi:hypothetical protein